jgi:hypothetical protein
VGSDKDNLGNYNRQIEPYIRYFGQFIFWAILGLVGWSFWTTLQHEKQIAVLEQRVTTLEKLVN